MTTLQLQRAIDISNYQGDLPGDVYRGWVGEGVRTVICGTDGSTKNPYVFPQQAAKVREVGLWLEAYTYLFFGEAGQVYDVAARTNRKLDEIDKVGGIKTVWLDAEQDGHGLEPWQVVNGLVYARDAVQARGYECGIYTRAEWWQRNTLDHTGFADLRWWLAHYSPIPGFQLDSLDTYLCGGIAADRLHRRQTTDQGVAGGYGPLDLNVERVVEAADAIVAESPAEDRPDDFQRGRGEVFFEGWLPFDERQRRERLALEEAQRRELVALEQLWGVRR